MLIFIKHLKIILSMVAEDYESRENLITPHIVISKDHKSVFLNTETFRNCQEHMIDPSEFKRALMSSEIDHSKFYKVTAVIGLYGFPLSDKLKTPARVSILRAKRPSNLLGYLEEIIVRKNLPKTFDYFNKKD